MQRRHAVIDTSLGPLTLVADGEALVGVYFPGHWHGPDPASYGPVVTLSDDPLFARAARQVSEYLAGARQTFDLPFARTGTQVQRSVWAMLDDIPYGRTTTYGDLATRLGDARRAREVGAAVGRNPLSMLVPCHRVIGKDGSLTGYAGGLDRKRALLELEGSLPGRALF